MVQEVGVCYNQGMYHHICVSCKHVHKKSAISSTVWKCFINPQHACTVRVTVLGVCVCVCVSVTQHLTFHMIIVPQTILTFLVADEGRKFSLKMLRCEARVFPVGMATWLVGHFLLRRKRTCIWIWTTWLAVLGRDVLCKFDYWLAVSIPPTKVWPQCKAAVPVRRKTCERCDHDFRPKRKAECNNLQEKAVWNVSEIS